MQRINMQETWALIQAENAIVKMIEATAGDNSHWDFILNQLLDPINCRPIERLKTDADRTDIYNPLTGNREKREFKEERRGRPKETEYTKQTNVTLLSDDAMTQLYTIAHGIGIIMDFEQRDKAREIRKGGIKYCFLHNSRTNDFWWIRNQPTSYDGSSLIRRAVSPDDIRRKNREARRRGEVPYWNDIRLGLAKKMLKGILVPHLTYTDKLNGIRCRNRLRQWLNIHLPILIVDTQQNIRQEYTENNQINDILWGFGHTTIAEQFAGEAYFSFTEEERAHLIRQLTHDQVRAVLPRLQEKGYIDIYDDVIRCFPAFKPRDYERTMDQHRFQFSVINHTPDNNTLPFVEYYCKALEGPGVNFNKGNRTPLAIAFDYKKLDVIKKMVELSKETLTSEELSQILLTFIAEKSWDNVAYLLPFLGRGVSTITAAAEGEALFRLIHAGQFELALTLSRKYGNTIAPWRTLGTAHYPMHACVQHGQYELLKKLYERGLSLTYENNQGETPLQLLINKNDEAVIKQFIDYFCQRRDVNMLGIMVSKLPINLAEYLINKVDAANLKLNAAHMSEKVLQLARASRFDLAEKLIARASKELSIWDHLSSGNSAMHYAVLEKKTGFIKFLHEKLDKNHYPYTYQNKAHQTPLDLALETQNWEMIKLMLVQSALLIPDDMLKDYLKKMVKMEFEGIKTVEMMGELLAAIPNRKVGSYLVQAFINETKDEKEVLDLVTQLETLKPDYLYKRQGCLQWSLVKHSWKNQDTSGTWVDLMKQAKNRILRLRQDGNVAERPGDSFLGQHRSGWGSFVGVQSLHIANLIKRKDPDAEALLQNAEQEKPRIRL